VLLKLGKVESGMNFATKEGRRSFFSRVMSEVKEAILERLNRRKFVAAGLALDLLAGRF